jgi:DNA-directed RNA polymerase subunit RPC12/RpoP
MNKKKRKTKLGSLVSNPVPVDTAARLLIVKSKPFYYTTPAKAPYLCGVCGQEFEQKFTLQAHKQSAHPFLYEKEAKKSEPSPTKAASCLICGATVTDDPKIKAKHMKRKHDSDDVLTNFQAITKT